MAGQQVDHSVHRDKATTALSYANESRMGDPALEQFIQEAQAEALLYVGDQLARLCAVLTPPVGGTPCSHS